MARMHQLPSVFRHLLLILMFSLTVIFLIFVTFDTRPKYSQSPPFQTTIKRWQTDASAVSFINVHEKACKKIRAKCRKRLSFYGDRHKKPTPLENGPFLDFGNVLLIVHFNWPNYESAAKVYALYQRIFAAIVFCGPDDSEDAFWPHFTKEKAYAVPSSVPFIAYGRYGNFRIRTNPYACFDLALSKLRLENNNDLYSYDGVLAMSDDVILNFWNLKSMGNKSLDKNWLGIRHGANFPFDYKTGKYCAGNSRNNIVDCRTFVPWRWETGNAAELLTFYSHLNSLQAGSLRTRGENLLTENEAKIVGNATNFWRQVKTNLTRVTGGEGRLLGIACADIFYVTKRYLALITPIFRLLARHYIFLEIAVPTAMQIVAQEGDIQPINLDAWDFGAGKIRGQPFITAYSTRAYEFVHPFKMSVVNDYYLTGSGTKSKKLSFEEASRDIDDTCVYCNLLSISARYFEFLT